MKCTSLLTCVMLDLSFSLHSLPLYFMPALALLFNLHPLRDCIICKMHISLLFFSLLRLLWCVSYLLHDAIDFSLCFRFDWRQFHSQRVTECALVHLYSFLAVSRASDESFIRSSRVQCKKPAKIRSGDIASLTLSSGNDGFRVERSSQWHSILPVPLRLCESCLPASIRPSITRFPKVSRVIGLCHWTTYVREEKKILCLNLIDELLSLSFYPFAHSDVKVIDPLGLGEKATLHPFQWLESRLIDCLD